MDTNSASQFPSLPVDSLQLIKESSLNVTRIVDHLILWENCMEQKIMTLDQRMSYLETAYQGPRITDSQAAEIKSAVQAIAQRLTQSNPSQNYYASIYNELQRRFGVTSYKNVPPDTYSQVLQWLNSWWASLTTHAYVSSPISLGNVDIVRMVPFSDTELKKGKRSKKTPVNEQERLL